MKIYDTNNIIRGFHNAKMNLNDDGTRNKEYHKIMEMKWVSLEDLEAWIDCELHYKDIQKRQFDNGYFHALKKLKAKLTENIKQGE